MPSSKKRGGAKSHRSRIAKRNVKIKQQESVMQKLFNESMRLQIEEMKRRQEGLSGETTNQ